MGTLQTPWVGQKDQGWFKKRYSKVREPYVPGRIFYARWLDGSENLLLALDKVWEYSVYRERYESIAFNGMHPMTLTFGFEPAWGKLTGFREITVKDLPLYISWDGKTEKFEALLKSGGT